MKITKEFTIRELMSVDAALTTLLSSAKMKPYTRIRLMRTAKSISGDTEVIGQERQKIIQEYCEKDENGQPKADQYGNLNVSPEGNAKWSEFMLSKIEVEFVPIYPSLIEDIEDVEISNQDAFAIDELME